MNTRERAPKPGVTWETKRIPVEILTDSEWIEVGAIEPPAAPYRPNRATRRAMARAARRRST